MDSIKATRKLTTKSTNTEVHTPTDTKSDTKPDTRQWKVAKVKDDPSTDTEEIEMDEDLCEDDHHPNETQGKIASKRLRTESGSVVTKEESTPEEPKKRKPAVKKTPKKAAKVIYLDENFRRLEHTTDSITADAIRVTYYEAGKAVVFHCLTKGGKRMFLKDIKQITEQLKELYKTYEKKTLDESRAPILPLIKGVLGDGGETLYEDFIKHHNKHNRSGHRSTKPQPTTETKTVKDLLKKAIESNLATHINILESEIFLLKQEYKKVDEMNDAECTSILENHIKNKEDVIKLPNTSDSKDKIKTKVEN